MARPGAEYEWGLAEIKRRNEAKEFPFNYSEVTSLYREKVANGELPDVMLALHTIWRFCLSNIVFPFPSGVWAA